MANSCPAHSTNLYERPLPDESLVDVEQDVAALDDHALDREVLADVLGLANLVKKKKERTVYAL